ncbi:hypothetical protein HWV62_5235 [Athelia sp. TMB]|nr:hypothetical protein HWV62_35812 [Athelia sp. TMB]KAF7985470.1 hypothetical protein HWV62_5235 [Athelia sp. TMB]
MSANPATKLGSHSRSAVLLPMEILATIFELGHLEFTEKLAGRIFILKVSHVCQQWRDAAANHQMLWTDVFVKIGRRTPRWPVLQCLARSGARPIDIHITSSVRIDDRTLGYATKLTFEMITAHSHRWRSFRAHCDTDVKLFYIKRALNTIHAPNLEDLKLEEEDDTLDQVGVPSPAPKSIFSLFTKAVSVPDDIAAHDILTGGAPLLKSVTLRNILCVPPMKVVRHLHLDNVYSRDSSTYNPAIDAIFSNLPLLQELTISGRFALSTTFSPSVTEINLPSLVTLRIRAHPGQLGIRGPLSYFLRVVSAPLLQSLVLENVSFSKIREDLHWNNRDFPLLRSLAVASWATHDSPRYGLVFLDNRFPAITHLNIRSSLAPADCFLHPNPEVQAWLKSETITLHELASNEITPFCDSLAKRSLTCPLPRRIVVRNCGPGVADALLMGLHDRGLHIEIYTSAGNDVPWYADV